MKKYQHQKDMNGCGIACMANLFRIKNGWVDPWLDLPSIDNVRAGVRDELPDDPWYVLYPIDAVI